MFKYIQYNWVILECIHFTRENPWYFFSKVTARHCGKLLICCDEIWVYCLSLWYQKLFSHVFFLDPEASLCLFLLLSWLFSKNLFLLFPHLTSIPIFFFFLFYVCQVFTLLERVTTLTSVSQLAAKSPPPWASTHIAAKPKCFLTPCLT